MVATRAMVAQVKRAWRVRMAFCPVRMAALAEPVVRAVLGATAAMVALAGWRWALVTAALMATAAMAATAVVRGPVGMAAMVRRVLTTAATVAMVVIPESRALVVLGALVQDRPGLVLMER